MTIALLIWGYARSIFGAVIAFCSKPPGSWIAAAGAACLALWYFGHLRYAAGVAAAVAAAAARAAQIKAKQDAEIAAVNLRADAEIAKSDKHNAENQEVIANVKKDAAAMPDAGGVAVTAAVADRLRGLH